MSLYIVNKVSGSWIYSDKCSQELILHDIYFMIDTKQGFVHFDTRTLLFLEFKR